MGAKPPYPLYYENGVVREESACGGQRMREHALSGKAILGIVWGNDRFHRPRNRVRMLSAGVRV